MDLWIFNASVSQPTSAVGSQLQQAFIASVTVAGLMTPADGKPSYILRLDGSSSYVSAGGYVAANVTGASSPAVATKTLAAYGFNVASVIQYSRVQYSSMLAAQPTYDKLKFGKKYVLGEAIAGLGVSNAFEYVPDRIDASFGVASTSFGGPITTWRSSNTLNGCGNFFFNNTVFSPQSPQRACAATGTEFMVTV